MNHLVWVCDPRQQEWEQKDGKWMGCVGGGAPAIYVVIACSYWFLDPEDLLRNFMKYVSCALPV